MFELSGVNYEEVLEQGDSILVRVIASSSYRGFELSGVRVIGIILYMFFIGILTLDKMSVSSQKKTQRVQRSVYYF